jgi:calcium-binding protein CML
MASHQYGVGGKPSAPPLQQGGYGQPPAGSYGQPPAGGYGYGQQPQGMQAWNQHPQYPPQPQYPPVSMFPPGTDPEIVQVFERADNNRSGTIDARELREVLSLGRYPFTDRTVRLMLHLFADNRNDTSRIGPVGFAKLWKEIKVWNAKFSEYDRDGSGTIDMYELDTALRSFNFAIPPQVLQMLVGKYDMTGGSRSIGYDNFVECGFVVKGLTEKFRDQDKHLSGNATFNYTDFMLLVVPFIAA